MAFRPHVQFVILAITEMNRAISGFEILFDRSKIDWTGESSAILNRRKCPGSRLRDFAPHKANLLVSVVSFKMGERPAFLVGAQVFYLSDTAWMAVKGKGWREEG